jgi:hypothetical protein
MVALDRVVDDAELVPVAAPTLTAQDIGNQPLHALLSEGRQPGLRTECHVDGVSPLVHRAWRVHDARA